MLFFIVSQKYCVFCSLQFFLQNLIKNLYICNKPTNIHHKQQKRKNQYRLLNESQLQLSIRRTGRTSHTSSRKTKPARHPGLQTTGRQNRNSDRRFHRHGRRPERTGKTVKKQMWRRRFRKRRANYHPRGIQRQNTRNPARQQLPRTLKQ